MRSQAVEASDELFGGLSLVLCLPVEPYSFKDNVLSDLEELLPRSCAYLPLSASLMLVDVRTSSASSPR